MTNTTLLSHLWVVLIDENIPKLPNHNFGLRSLYVLFLKTHIAIYLSIYLFIHLFMC
jgi:hypothetical protein